MDIDLTEEWLKQNPTGLLCRRDCQKLLAVAKAAKIVNLYLSTDHPGERALADALADLEGE